MDFSHLDSRLVVREISFSSLHRGLSAEHKYCLSGCTGHVDFHFSAIFKRMCDGSNSKYRRLKTWQTVLHNRVYLYRLG